MWSHQSQSPDFGLFGVPLFLWQEKEEHRKSWGSSCSFWGQIWGQEAGRCSEASLTEWGSMVKLPKEGVGLGKAKEERRKV